MTTTAKFKFDFSPYLEKLAAAGQDIDAAADRAAMAGAEVLQRGMKRRVAKLTGNLEDHIVIDGPNVDGNRHMVEVGVITRKGLTDPQTARQANAQEYGTSSMAAHPYARPTEAEDRGAALKAVKELLKKDGTI